MRDDLVMVKGYSIEVGYKLFRSHSFRNSIDKEAGQSVSLEK